jgi:multidrug efflux pump subunit AcrB
MWIVKLALNRPYTFIVMALLILIISPVVILRTPTDIFPNIDIPVISVAWQYAGLNAEEVEGRITSPFERSLSTLVDNIQHLESTSYNGEAVIKIFLQPGANLANSMAQVTAVAQQQLKQMPPGEQPPEIINYSASSVPILQIGLSGKGLNEQQLNDLAGNFIRTQIVTVPGAVVPAPYGGKIRQVMVNLDPRRMQARGLSSTDVLNAVASQNLILPSGTAKIGQDEYYVRLNASPTTVAALNDLPVKQIGQTTIYLHDVATVSDGFTPQTNIARQDGQRGVLVLVLKAGNASTISVVKGVRRLLPRIALTVPPQLKMQPLQDQSIFVEHAVSGVVREGVIAAALTGLMILLFLGSWRSTLIIAISIPLSILTSILTLSFLHETINIMTLGGLALAVGILVDDATVTIENIERYLEEGYQVYDAILEGAAQIAIPALVSTLCICIVFLPMFFLSGVSRYLFVPLAEAVVFAMLASYVLSRTLVPTLALYLLKLKDHHRASSRNPLARFQQAFESGFQRLRGAYHLLLSRLVYRRSLFVPVFLGACLCPFLLLPFLGQDFFPASDSGEFILHLRAKTGTRIEETARLCDLVENSIRKVVPREEMGAIVDNIGLPYSPMNTMHSTNGMIGAGDADITVSLDRKHHPTAGYIRSLRRTLPQQFPGVMFYFLPADIITQILNFGLPAPIDVQIEGSDIQANRGVADQILNQLRHVPGIADPRIQQAFDYPSFNIDVDRTKAMQAGYTESDVGGSLLNSLSGSFQTSPMFFLNWQNGVEYSLTTQAPQYDVQSLQDLQDISLSGRNALRSEILADVASIQRSHEMEAVDHYNIRRVIDIYASVQDRDLGAVGRNVLEIVDQDRKLLPRGSFITVRGQLETMRASYLGLVSGLGFSIVLVYLLIVVNFQSWLDPFIIITALPAALAGIILFLFVTHTTLSVPALMGAIMCMGVATANSILVVSFAKEKLLEHSDPARAAIEAGATRFRPVIMTALAMIIGMVPMALGMGDGGEQNAPLGRAVIGGLLCATVATLTFVPAVFSLLHRGPASGDAQSAAARDREPLHA